MKTESEIKPVDDSISEGRQDFEEDGYDQQHQKVKESKRNLAIKLLIETMLRVVSGVECGGLTGTDPGQSWKKAAEVVEDMK